MKYFAYFSFLFITIILSSISCTKEGNGEKNDVEKQEYGSILLQGDGNNNTIGLKATNPKMRTLICHWDWMWNGSSYQYMIIWCNCVWPRLNCLPTVVITPSDRSEYDSFKHHYDQGLISDYFSTDDYRSIFPDLDDLGVVSGLRNGEITLSLFSDTISGKDFYIGLPNDTKFSTTDTT